MSNQGPIQIVIDERRFLELVAKETGTKFDDYLTSIRAANLGILRAQNRKLSRDANQLIFADDIVPLLPNSIFKVYVQVSGVASILDIDLVFGTNRITGKALDGTALQPSIPKEFNHPVGRDMKVNYFPEIATTIQYIRVVEFRIGQ